MNEIRVGITGGGWLTSQGYGCLRDGVTPVFGPSKVVIPTRRELFDRGLPRYGRFDDYTKLGCAAMALALRDAGLENSAEKRPIGIVSSSKWETMSTDLVYYETALAQDGAGASPNLFSYTLPGVMQGECAVHFGLTGPTICVGEEGGRGVAALGTALRIMADGAASVMMAGWLDDPPEGETLPPDTRTGAGGALFVVLEERPRPSPGAVRWIRYQRGQMRLDDGREVTSLSDLFGE